MGIFTKIANLFRPKEFRQAVSEGESELKAAKRKAKKEAKDAKNDYRQAMGRTEIKKAKKELHDAEERIWEASKQSQKVIVDWNQFPDRSIEEQRKFFSERIKTQDEKDEELAKEIQKGFKAMETDRLERMNETLLRIYKDLAPHIKEAQKLSDLIDKLFYEQDDLLMSSKELVQEKKKLDERAIELFGKSDAELLAQDEKLNKELDSLLKKRSGLNRKLLETLKKASDLAQTNSRLRKELNNLLLVLEPLDWDAKIFRERIADEVKNALERIRFEGEIRASTERSIRKISEEIRDEEKAEERLRKAAGRSF